MKKLRRSQNVHLYAWKAFVLKQGPGSQKARTLKLISIRHRSDTYVRVGSMFNRYRSEVLGYLGHCPL